MVRSSLFRKGIRLVRNKLAFISRQKDGEVCCFTLIKADAPAERVKEFLGPVLKGMTGNG
jgi:hypothetical protein